MNFEILALEPADDLRIFYGKLDSTTKLLQVYSELEERVLLDLDHEIKEIQFIDAVNEVIDFYYYNVIVPVGGLSIYIQLKREIPKGLNAKGFTLMFSQGRESPSFKKIDAVLSDFIDRNLISKQWEQVDVIRPV